ncbi:MAG: hypothetical protein KF773_03420 [Deltaproteobacteria bacterium]|nr:hypothetical protein [Deltaproteobacteria bacterium]MCW5801622.1 hypothetical protein [Deltaproteobacteria bacterium]
MTADAPPAPDAPTTTFSFFITSTGGPDGGNFGGLAGADDFCRTKAVAAVPAAATRVWRAYLSTDTIDARDRIGAGPWLNVNGVTVATSVANLHDAAANQLSGDNSVDETGAMVPNNQHDIITGSLADGTKSPNTCASWTSNAATGITTTTGHSNRQGGGADPTSWNNAHTTQGCSAQAFINTGGRGSIYCFAE